MSRRILALVTLLFVLLQAAAITPARAGGQRWSAWLYEPPSGQMLLLTDTMGGKPQALMLPKPSGFDTYDRSVAISHDWHYMAYVVSNSKSGAKSLVVYDRNGGSTLFTVPVGSNDSASVDFSADELIFNETSNALAFGLSLNGMQGWEVRVIAFGTGGGGPTLRHDSPAIAPFGIRKEFTLPVVRRYHGSEVTFNIVHLATEGSPHYDSYTWNISTGEVQRDLAYPSLATDTYAPTGETVSPTLDPRFPSCGDPCGPFFSGNTLSVYTPAVNGIFPYYSANNLSLFRAVFIQNGERVIFGGSGPSTGDMADWSVLDRTGALVGSLPPVSGGLDSIIGWEDGLLYMPGILNPADPPQLYLVNTRDGLDQGTVVWTGKDGAQIRLVQTPGNMQFTGPFAPWKQLSAPTTALSVRDMPPNAPVLTVGKLAIVNTTQGDKLRVRSGPGRSFAVVAMLDKGTLVTLLEGPRDADGLTWWRIRAPSGAEGWVVESVEDNGQRIQTLLPG
jgi:Bacterial SH3 domain